MYLIGLLLLTLPSVALSQGASKVATTGAQFLKMEPGSRAMGMGGAYGAIANDASAIWWNPAGMSRLDKNEVMFMHANWLAGINYDFFAAVARFGDNAVGASITSLNYGQMEVTTVQQPDGTGQMFTPTSFALTVGYSRKLSENFSFGVNGKYVNDQIKNSSASAFAFDVGTLYDVGILSIGAAVSNFGTKMQMGGSDLTLVTPVGNDPNVVTTLQTQAYDLPLRLRVGVAFHLIHTEMNNLVVASDVVHSNDNYEYVNVGGEYRWNNVISLRAGYSELGVPDREAGLTFGAGVRIFLTNALGAKFDYSYGSYGRLLNVQRFTFALDF
ncbi:MAG TPA: PorV/PorQ family protein [Candidatus Kryptobacter bacterium]|nr:PorV/PorQ family protein [Candidatus Kryptobacter bacterium]